jgi:hypothetical membrane protein
MTWSWLDVAVLLVFGAMAAIGIASQPRNNSTAADWMGRFGLIGAVAWVAWIFFRPGGVAPSDLVKTFKEIFSQ